SLAAKEENGLLIVGASPWSQALAKTLTKLDIDVVVTDGSYQRLKPIRMDGIKVYYGELLSEHAQHELEDEHLSFLLCATDNHYYNALVCKAQGHAFGHHRTFQLAPGPESGPEQKRLTVPPPGYLPCAAPTRRPDPRPRLPDGSPVQCARGSKRRGLKRLQSGTA